MIKDAKSLCVALERSESSTRNLTERRTATEATAIKQRLEHGFIYTSWVNSDSQMADRLTKPQAWKLLEIMSARKWRIVWDPMFQSARFFLTRKIKGKSVSAKLPPFHLSKKRSARSGTHPSVPDHTSLGPATSEAAKERPQEMTNICTHRRRQAKCAERRNTGGESRAFVAPKAFKNSTALRAEPASSLYANDDKPATIPFQQL